MSMIRAPPLPPSSVSMTYGWPPIVTGIVICAVEPSGQVTSPTTRIWGTTARFWMSETSRIVMPLDPLWFWSAMSAR